MSSIIMPARTYPSARERLMKPKRHNSLPSTPQTSADASGTSDSRTAISTQRTSPAGGTESHRRHRPRQALHASFPKRARNHIESLPSPPASQHQYHEDASYARTSHSHASVASQYQVTSTFGLPSATRWLHQCSVADRERIDDDLLGLNLNQPSYAPYSLTARIPEEDFECASESMGLPADMNGEPAGGVGWYGVWRTEAGAIFAWDHDGNSSPWRAGYLYDFVNSIDDTVANL
ncbi:hypothetical protein BDZ45DRAFT_797334 [Acephala macrosclerotiorum]|nr:hypothetical protein BDZ45DRAFT_797334 [Acephala macrosclerotiorum]